MLEVRPLQAEEWRLLKSVRLKALADAPEAFSATLAEAQMLSDAEWEQRAQRYTSNPRSRTWLAFWNDMPCGMIACALLEYEGISSLAAVWVDPEYRRQRVGEALIAATVQWSLLQGVNTVAAWVTEHNTRAIAFYERVGFQRTNHQEVYKPDPTKSIVLFVRKLPSLEIEPQDTEPWIRRCRELAEEAQARGDAPVGAVITLAGEIIAEAGEQVRAQRDLTGHAELIALRRACERLGTMDLSGCILCTNVEPCWMCSYAIREAKISAVVIGRPVEDIGGVTSRYPLLSDAAIEDWGMPPSILWSGLFSASLDRPGEAADNQQDRM